MLNFSLKSIIDKLTNSRKEQSLTQNDFAALLQIPQSYIAKIESGNTDLRTTKLIEMARVLGLEVMLVPQKHMYLVNQVLSADEKQEQRQKHVSMYEPDEPDDE